MPPPIATDVGVIAPSVKVIAGVVVGVATVPETPLAVVTEALLTDPVPVPQVGQEMAVPDTTIGAVPVTLLPAWLLAVLMVGLTTMTGAVPPESVAVTLK